MAAALVAEVRDRHADQRIDARRQIQREAAEKYREEAKEPSVIEKDVLDRAAGIIIAAADATALRPPAAIPSSAPAAAPGAASATVVLTEAGPQAFVVVAALVVDRNL